MGHVVESDAISEMFEGLLQNKLQITKKSRTILQIENQNFSKNPPRFGALCLRQPTR